MLLNGTLWPHLQDVQKAACACLERTITTLLDKYPAPDKERAQLLWVAHMNGLKAQMEEVVVREVVYANETTIHLVYPSKHGIMGQRSVIP